MCVRFGSEGEWEGALIVAQPVAEAVRMDAA